MNTQLEAKVINVILARNHQFGSGSVTSLNSLGLCWKTFERFILPITGLKVLGFKTDVE